MDKPRYSWSGAVAVAGEICKILKPATDKICVAGSLRRRKQTVGDIEIVYISRVEPGPITDLFAPPDIALSVDRVLAAMIAEGRIAKRRNAKDCEMWGDWNKLAIHVASGIPIDFFRTTPDRWANYLVCRTGGADSNIAIALAAKRAGWSWNPYAAGFSRVIGLDTETHTVHSEREVFEFVGLPYREPWER